MSAASLPTAASVTDLMAAGRTALRDGEPLGAANAFALAAQSAVNDPEPRYWLAAALSAAGETDAARTYMADAATLHSIEVMRAAGVDLVRMQRDRAYAAEVGRQFYGLRHMAPASVALGRALDFDNLDLQLLLSYGLSLQHQGRTEEALDVFTAAVEAFPDPTVHEFLLYVLFFVSDGVQRYAAEAKAWAQRYTAGLTPASPTFPNARDAKRRLKVGYMAPSFTRSQLAQFIVPVLEAHDPTAVELVLYAADPAAEASLPPHALVRRIGGVPDEAVAAMVRNDGVDILIDLWGHTAGSRLRVFAMRPAPVQLAWMNFVQTTGVEAIDYVLHCDSMQAEGTSDLFVERIWNTGVVMTPYRPAADRPAPTPAPAKSLGRITFGSFNNPVKLSAETVAAWSRILQGRPTSRLVLKYGMFADPVLQRITRARFAAYGIEADRIEFRAHSSGQEYLLAFREIDLALDPSPCPGGTTTCDALANGVPVLTLAGADFYARIGLNPLLACGLPELIAETWDDYVAQALALTEDLEALDALRGRVRPAFDASAFRDEEGFVQRLEADYRKMFEAWLSEGGSGDALTNRCAIGGEECA